MDIIIELKKVIPMCDFLIRNAEKTHRRLTKNKPFSLLNDNKNLELLNNEDFNTKSILTNSSVDNLNYIPLNNNNNNNNNNMFKELTLNEDYPNMFDNTSNSLNDELENNDNIHLLDNINLESLFNDDLL